jgi:hypothetical protein
MSAPEAERLTLGLWRIAIFSALSAGLYYVYWFYRTWKQLAQESQGQERFYPVWHALTQLVPVYGQFRLHRHTALIREIAMTSIPELRLSPWAVVALFVAAAVAGVASSGGVAPLVVLTLLVANTALVTVTMAWPQSALNRYWRASRGPSVRAAALGVGEVVVVVVGLSLLWTLPLLMTWVGANAT